MSLELVASIFAVLGFLAIVLRFLPRDWAGRRRLPRVVDESIGMWAIRRLLRRPTETLSTAEIASDLPQPTADEIAWRIGAAEVPPRMPASLSRSGIETTAPPAAPIAPAPRPAGPLPPAELVAAARAILERPAPVRRSTRPRSALSVQRRVAVLVTLAFAAASIAALGLSARGFDGDVLSVTGSPPPAAATAVPTGAAAATPRPTAAPDS